jgi:hypothetical protein
MFWAWIDLLVLGAIALVEGAYEEAQRYLCQSVTAYKEWGRRDELGWAHALLGYAARGLGQHSEAEQHLRGALRTGVELGAFFPIIYALPGVALLLADRGEVERAVALYALAARHPFVANSRWFEDVAGQQIAAAAETLAPDVVAAARERGQAGDLWATAEELLAEWEER